MATTGQHHSDRHIGHTDRIRVVMLGKTGAGKSSLGNSLLGPKTFKVGRGVNSETRFSDYGCALQTPRNIEFQVVDTPGLCDTHKKEDQIFLELGKSVAMTTPGPHIILVVLRCDRRFTPEEFQAYETLKTLFGKEMCKFMIVIFNGLDGLVDPDLLEETELSQLRDLLEESVKEGTAPDHLRQVLQDASGRYFGINNLERRHQVMEKQLEDLVDHIMMVVEENDHQYYSNKLYAEIKQRMEKLARLRIKEEKIKQNAKTEAWTHCPGKKEEHTDTEPQFDTYVPLSKRISAFGKQVTRKTPVQTMFTQPTASHETEDNTRKSRPVSERIALFEKSIAKNKASGASTSSPDLTRFMPSSPTAPSARLSGGDSEAGGAKQQQDTQAASEILQQSTSHAESQTQQKSRSSSESTDLTAESEIKDIMEESEEEEEDVLEEAMNNVKIGIKEGTVDATGFMQSAKKTFGKISEKFSDLCAIL